MKNSIFQREVTNIEEILDRSLVGGDSYDISSKIYLADLYDDFVFIDSSTDQKDTSLLDVGCGKGHLSALLSFFLKKKVSAIDLVNSFGDGGGYSSKNMGIEWQKNVWNEFSCKYGVIYSFYDGKIMPYEDSSFDVLVLYAVIEHVDNENLFLKECFRVLKPRGKLFIFRCPSKFSLTENVARLFCLPHHERLYNEHELKKMFCDSSFTIVKMEKYDTFPAFFPIKALNLIWNKFFYFGNFLRIIFKLFPFVFFAHHYRFFVIKNEKRDEY